MLWLSQFSSKIGKDDNNLNTLEELEFEKKTFKKLLEGVQKYKGDRSKSFAKKPNRSRFFSGMASFMSHCQLTKTLNQLFLANARLSLAFSSICSKLLIKRSLSAGDATFVPVMCIKISAMQ